MFLILLNSLKKNKNASINATTLISMMIMSFFSHMANAELPNTTSISISGNVIARTCTLADSSLSLQLDTIAVSDFDKLISVGRKEILIKLVNCTIGETFNISFYGKQDPDDKNAFLNDSAKNGVGIRFYDQDGSIIPADPVSSTKKNIVINKASTTLYYAASYVRTGTPKAGKVSSVVNVKFEYE